MAAKRLTIHVPPAMTLLTNMLQKGVVGELFERFGYYFQGSTGEAFNAEVLATRILRACNQALGGGRGGMRINMYQGLWDLVCCITDDYAEQQNLYRWLRTKDPQIPEISWPPSSR